MRAKTWLSSPELSWTILDIKWNFRRNQHKEYKPWDQWKPKLKLFSSNESLQILLENCLRTMNFRKVSVSLVQGGSQWWTESWEKSGRDKKLANCVTLEDTRGPLAGSWDSLDTFYCLSGPEISTEQTENWRSRKKPPQRNEVKLKLSDVRLCCSLLTTKSIIFWPSSWSWENLHFSVYCDDIM